MKHTITLIIIAGCLTSCAVPESKIVAAHAAGEALFSPVAFGAMSAPRGTSAPVSPEAEKSKAFWGN